MIYKEGLTIAIPTYNRKEPLFKMLKSILKQGHRKEYQLLIIDNHSDYDIRQMITERFSEEVADTIVIQRWNFNTGMSANLSFPFLLTATKWLWLLGDDDEICNGSLERIINDIRLHPNALAIKYSLKGGYIPNDDITLKSVREFSAYYSQHYRVHQMMFLSNIYNLEELHPYLTNVFDYSYTYISFLIPIIKGLIDHKPYVLSSFPFVYYNNDSEDNWTKKCFKKVLLGYCSFADIEFDISIKEIKDLYKTIFLAFPFRRTLKWLLSNTNRTEAMMMWKRLFPIFQSHGLIRQLAASLLVHLYCCCGINLRKLI